MENNNFYEALKHYFNTTPKDKVLEDWDKSAEHDKIGVTVEEFLDNTKKQETLEEAAEKYAKQFDYAEDSSPQVDFIEGAKWQQERMYSEEDLREAFKQSRQALIFEKDMPPVYENFEEWFEQFKKK